MGFWDERPDPTDADVEAVALTWIRYQERWADEMNSPDDDPDWWAVSAVIDASDKRHVEILWRLIVKLGELVDPDPDGTLGMVAAGPLYDYIVFNDGLGRVEAAAADSPALLSALTGVWSDESINAQIDEFLTRHGQERRSD